MPAIPTPPGLWRALARDAVLNPEERAARDAVRAVWAHLAPPATVPPRAGRPLTERLQPYQLLIDLAGWKFRSVATEERAGAEGLGPNGAAVMVTVTIGRPVRAYVLRPSAKRSPHWLATSPTAVGHFIEHGQLPAKAKRHRPDSKCRCGKKGRFPSEAWAQKALVNILINKELRQKRHATERRVYRCPGDDRVWHQPDEVVPRDGTETHQARKDDPMTTERVNVRVLLLFGDQAEITTPYRDHMDPERVPVARLVRETGVQRDELVGAELVAVVGDEGELVRFERA
ncbi:hypothetical protein [Streptomyces roseochromogenus]|nr:hypothetical protein [Streptomyces roseochromogenus]